MRRSRDVEIENRTADVPAAVLVDGQPVGELAPGESVVVRLGAAVAACWRICPRRRSSAATGRPLLRRLRIENLVLIREADLEPAPGLNAITGETGAGKTILAQAIGLLLGAKGDAGVRRARRRRGVRRGRVRPPSGLLEEEGMEALAELRPEGEEGLVLARRVFADGRTRAYAWGRSAAREDLAAAGERLIAMSGQFEQRRLARPAYQLGVLDSFAGEEQLRLAAELRAAWRELAAARRRHEELDQGAAAEEARVAELRALVEDTEGLAPDAEDALRAERERLRHVNELALARERRRCRRSPPRRARVPPALSDGPSGAWRAVAAIAPELERAAGELRDAELRLGETALELRRFLDSLQAEPGRLDQVEAELDRISEAKRRFRCESYGELLGPSRRCARASSRPSRTGRIRWQPPLRRWPRPRSGRRR